ncbi:MAG: arginine deiminase-related protein [Bacteroidota bacterium]
MFKKAIVRKPCPEMIHGITSASLGVPDHSLALNQHDRYIQTLQSLGLEVTVLESDSRFPDSTFVEDVALCTPPMAVITNPGAASRNGERKDMERVLKSFYPQLEYIEAPGTLEAGDVMMCGSHYFIGISDRTNEEGAGQLIRILEQYGMTGECIVLKKLLHLKSGVSYLENGTLLAGKVLFDHPAFEDFQKIEVADDEAYAANSLWMNGTVLVPAGFPKTLNRIEKAGFTTITLDVSEFEKLDGGMSCLSLRF